MLPDRVSNPGRLTYESGALPIALRGPALLVLRICEITDIFNTFDEIHLVFNSKK